MPDQYPKVRFTEKVVNQVGDLGDVLTNFLELQKESLQTEFNNAFANGPEDLVKRVLNEFASLEGTKVPLRITDLLQSGFDKSQLDFCLDRLEKSRILREDEGMFEIAHDSLALQIANSRSAEERSLLEMENLVRSRFGAAIQTFLTEKELESIAHFEDRLRLNPDEKAFLAKSRSNQLKETSKKWVNRIVLVGLAVFLGMIGLFAYLITQEGYRLRTTLLPYQSLSALKQEKNPTKAFKLGQYAMEYDKQKTTDRDDQAMLDAWYNEDNAPLHTSFLGHTDRINSIKFTGDGSYFLTASNDSTAKIWDSNYLLATENPNDFLHNFQHMDKVNHAEFSPEERFILTCSNDRTAKLWDRWDGLLLDTFKHIEEVRYGTFIPSTGQILTLSGDNTWMVYDMPGKTPPEPDIWRETFAEVTAIYKNMDTDNPKYRYFHNIIFSNDGEMIIMNHSDGFVPRYRSNNFGFLQFEDEWNNSHASLSFDENSITSINGKTLRVFKKFQNNQWKISESYNYPLEFNAAFYIPYSEYVIASFKQPDNEVRILIPGKTLTTYSTIKETKEITSFDFYPDGIKVITGHIDGEIKLWDYFEHKAYNYEGAPQDYTFGQFIDGSNSAYLINESSRIDSIDWSKGSGNKYFFNDGDIYDQAEKIEIVYLTPDSKFMLTHQDSSNQKIWDLDNKTPLDIQIDDSILFTNFAISPKKDLAILGHENDSSTFISLNNGSGQLGFHEKELKIALRENIQFALFTADGKMLITNKGPGSLVKSVNNNDAIRSFPDGISAMTGGRLYGNDSLFLGIKEDLSICLYRIKINDTGHNEIVMPKAKELAHFLGNQSKILSARLSKDQNWVVSLSYDNSVFLWTSSGKLISRAKIPFPLFDVNFLEDGSTYNDTQPIILALTKDGSVVHIEMDTERLAEKADRLGITDLTDEEKKTYQIKDNWMTRWNLSMGRKARY